MIERKKMHDRKEKSSMIKRKITVLLQTVIDLALLSSNILSNIIVININIIVININQIVIALKCHSMPVLLKTIIDLALLSLNILGWAILSPT